MRKRTKYRGHVGAKVDTGRKNELVHLYNPRLREPKLDYFWKQKFSNVRNTEHVERKDITERKLINYNS